jgi:hypothetical protein
MSSSPTTVLPGEVGNAAEIAAILAKDPGSTTGAVLRRGRAPQVAVDAKITAPKRLVMVSKVHTEPKRVEIVVSTTSSKFPRGGKLELITTATSGSIRFFDAEKEGNEVLNNTISVRICTAVELNAGFHMFAQGAKPSGALDDVRIKLTLDAGPTTGKPAEITLTAVELTLDISPPRTSSANPFTPLPQPQVLAPNVTPTDKWFAGVVINAQDPDNNQPRAQLIVRQVKPSAFAGELVLQQVAVVSEKAGKAVNRAQLFESEIPGPKQTPKVTEKAKTNPFFFKTDTITSPAGREFFIEGKTGSATLRDTAFQLGIRNVENDGDRVAFAVAIAPLITADSKIVVAKKPHTTPARRKITLRTSAAFDGKGTLKRSDSGPIKFFDKSKDGAEIDLKGTGHEFPSDEMKKGVNLFAESESPSSKVDECELTFALEQGAKPVGAAATLSLTAFDFTLDISGPRTAPAVEPPALSLADKSNPGRFLQRNNTVFSHLRALLVMRLPKPAGFTGTLVLTPISSKVRVFRAETPAAGQNEEKTPFTIPVANMQPTGERFFAEGVTASNIVRDTGFRLGVQGLENEADRVAVTVFDLAITNNIAPFATPVQRVQIEGVLNRDRTAFKRSKLFLQQPNSLFRVRLDMPGLAGNTTQVRLRGVRADTTIIESQDINLTRTSGNRFVSRQTLAIPKDLPRADITFAAPQDIEVILCTAAGTLKAEMLGTFVDTGIARLPVRGRVREMCTVVIQGAAPNIAANLATANRVMAQCGIEFRILTQIPPINNAALLDIAQADCPLTIGGDNARGIEETALFALGRAQCATNFIIYFVRSNSMGLFGCSAFPVGQPGVTVADTATQYTFCHEICHVLHLPHDGRTNNLMTGNGTNSLPPNPRDVNLLPDQLQLLDNGGFITFRE